MAKESGGSEHTFSERGHDDKTGAAGIKHWIEAHYQIEIGKHDARVTRIKDMVDAEYTADRVSAISDDEMFEWTRQAFGDSLPPIR